MTEDTVLDTTIHQPSMTASEADVLLFALDRSRAQFAWKCGGLEAAGLSKPSPQSAMTLGGLVKHLALVEDDYAAVRLTGQPVGPPWNAVDFDADPDWEWRTAADDSPAELYALWRGAVERCRAAMTRALADGGLDQRTLSARPSTAWSARTPRHDGRQEMTASQRRAPAAERR
jgi:hypothetical protein